MARYSKSMFELSLFACKSFVRVAMAGVLADVVLDVLFGKAEPMDYVSTTTPPPPPSLA